MTDNLEHFSNTPSSTLRSVEDPFSEYRIAPSKSAGRADMVLASADSEVLKMPAWPAPAMPNPEVLKMQPWERKNI